MSKLWTTFQSQYRLSAAYAVSVILIDSQLPVRAALPVLTRGQDDSGPIAVAGGAPNVSAVLAPHSQPAGRLGDAVRIDGAHLEGATTVFSFASLAPGQPVVQLNRRNPLPDESPGIVMVQLPSSAEDPGVLGHWVPGFYAVSAAVDLPNLPRLVSNSVPFALAPTITVTPNAAMPDPASPTPVAVGDTLTLTCSPRAQASQRVQLVLGDLLLEPTSLTNPLPGSPSYDQTPTTLAFEVPDLRAGIYTVRLRVDGVDSLPILFPDSDQPPRFDPAQQVKVS
jgi:hypothetical protein